MKTEQEQIEEMRITIYNTRSKVNGIATAGDIAEALVQAGYGDVSEYKAEIERLKAGTKQAKIDVLKKLRSRIADKESLIQSYIADGCLTIEDMYTEIDELIEEVENDK